MRWWWWCMHRLDRAAPSRTSAESRGADGGFGGVIASRSRDLRSSRSGTVAKNSAIRLCGTRTRERWLHPPNLAQDTVSSVIRRRTSVQTKQVAEINARFSAHRVQPGNAGHQSMLAVNDAARSLARERRVSLIGSGTRGACASAPLPEGSLLGVQAPGAMHEGEMQGMRGVGAHSCSDLSHAGLQVFLGQ